MDSNKTYIIADFVKILDVPRTTLKDWMTRYEEYIEFEIRGRRKIYFESSLLVLKEIAKMRKDGKTASEILLELSYTHPINVDIAHEIEAPQIEVPVIENENFPVKNNPLIEALLPIVKQQNEEMEHMLNNKLHDMAGNLHEAQLATLLPIVKRQNDKMERMLTHKLHDMAENLHRNQLDGNKLSKQSSRRILLVIALILTLVVALFFTSSNMYYLLMNQKQDLKSVEKGIQKNIAQSNDLFVGEIQKSKKNDKEQLLKLQKLSIMFEHAKLKSDNDMLNLKNELRKQQKSFMVMMAQYNKLVKEERQNDTIFFKGTASKERNALVQKIDELIKQGAHDKFSENKEGSEILSLKEKLFELKQKMQALEQGKSQAEQAARQSALRASYLSKSIETMKAKGKAVEKAPTRPEKIIIR